MSKIDELLDRNKAWSAAVSEKDPEFFPRSAASQAPQYLWIGCSDSRVSASQIVGSQPGEVFVHRNIANVVVHTDFSCLSVMQYAIEVLKVKHVIVCGHYGCGGVNAALGDQSHGLIDNWLRHIKNVASLHADELAQVDEARRSDLMCELNVREQVENVCRTTIVQDAWKRGDTLSVHGWIYGIEDGILRDLDTCLSSNEELSERMG